MARQPLARGRLAYIAETYQSNEIDPRTNQPKEKNRYATLGKVTAWPAENGGVMPQISIDMDALPLGVTGSTKLMVFWDDQAQQGSYTQGYDQQQHAQQAPPQSYDSWGNMPQQPAQQGAAPQNGFNQPNRR